MSREAVQRFSVGAAARGDSDSRYARDQEISDLTWVAVIANAPFRLRLPDRLRNIGSQPARGGVLNLGYFGFAAANGCTKLIDEPEDNRT
ncbi:MULTISPECIES: hypothetical protein [unclassified Mesorhizobium]|uniref:hypothetical protein n=1 Tax=Mesorhizobium sp. M5C.F.Cr.IN.023.01.1.1 TaxID=2496768 RepID=UPI001FE1742D|nr:MULTISPECIES: hypothetical protein [unclassified Mesorhizobium]